MPHYLRLVSLGKNKRVCASLQGDSAAVDPPTCLKKAQRIFAPSDTEKAML